MVPPKIKTKKVTVMSRVPQLISEDRFPSQMSPSGSTYEGTPRTPGCDLELHSPTQEDVVPRLEEEEEQEAFQDPIEEAIRHEEGDIDQPDQPLTQQEDATQATPHASEESDEGLRQRQITLPRRQESLLAEWLQENQFLYNRSLPDYKNKEKKKGPWRKWERNLFLL